MTSSTPTVSVVICAYTEDRWDDIVAAVDSVQGQTLAPKETLVVVDHNPRLLDRVRTELSGIASCANTGPQGLSGGRNTGWRATTGDVIAFLDDDAAASPDWLEQLVVPYADPQVVGVGGSISPNWHEGQPSAFPEEFLWVVGCSYIGLPVARSEVRNMIGANMSLRRSALDKTTGFDTDLGRVGTRPVGCEETELCLRLVDASDQGRIIYQPAAHVRHSVPASRATFQYFRSRCYAEGISKAHVSRLSGASAALSSEADYVRKTLPLGVLRALREGVRSRQSAPFLRVGGIMLGLTFTTAGYGVGLLRRSTPSAAPNQQVLETV